MAITDTVKKKDMQVLKKKQKILKGPDGNNRNENDQKKITK